MGLKSPWESWSLLVVIAYLFKISVSDGSIWVGNLKWKNLSSRSSPVGAGGAATMFGGHSFQQDRFIVNAPLEHVPDAYLFAVFDGHGHSASVSNFLRENAPLLLGRNGLGDKALIDDCYELDRRLQLPKLGFQESGSTGSMAIVHPAAETGWFEVITLNLGDSRTTLIMPPLHNDKLYNIHTENSTLNQRVYYARMTKDHKPDNPTEKKRITNAKASVANGQVARVRWPPGSPNYKSKAGLAVSRAFGDMGFKYYQEAKGPVDRLAVCATCDVHRLTIPAGSILVVATDGCYNEHSNLTWESVAAITSIAVAMHPFNLAKAAQILIDTSYQWGSRDNITAVIATLGDVTSLPPFHGYDVAESSAVDLSWLPIGAFSFSPILLQDSTLYAGNWELCELFKNHNQTLGTHCSIVN